MKLYEIRKLIKNGLASAGIDAPEAEAVIFIENKLGIDRNEIILRAYEDIDDRYIEDAKTFVAERSNGKPVQYIINEAYFMGRKLFVAEGCLIPRQDTELVVSKAVELLRKYMNSTGKKNAEVLDMCTGSGCIAIAIADAVSAATVTAVDISDKALAIARRNIEACGLKDKISAIKSDLFENPALDRRFDMIISNPPYIKTDEIFSLSTEVKDYEPFTALNGGEDGLEFYEKILKKGLNCLNEHGIIVFELGIDQVDCVCSFMDKFGYKDVGVEKDFANIDRIIYAYAPKASELT